MKSFLKKLILISAATGTLFCYQNCAPSSPFATEEAIQDSNLAGENSGTGSTTTTTLSTTTSTTIPLSGPIANFVGKWTTTSVIKSGSTDSCEMVQMSISATQTTLSISSRTYKCGNAQTTFMNKNYELRGNDIYHSQQKIGTVWPARLQISLSESSCDAYLSIALSQTVPNNATFTDNYICNSGGASFGNEFTGEMTGPTE